MNSLFSFRRKRKLGSAIGARLATLTIGTLVAGGAGAFCFDEAAAHYGVPALLLRAIAEQESSMNPRAVNRANADGSRDVGLMQINSQHFPLLARFGITEERLFEPCTNTYVGAWVLANAFRAHGHSWEAVGAYNAGGSAAAARARAIYAWNIYRRLKLGMDVAAVREVSE